MKTQTSTTRILALLVVTAALTGSLAQNASQPPPAAPRPASPAPALADADSQTSPAASAPRLSPWTTEIVKLAHAGIDEGVVLSFIQNSGMFNLGADQIIHLAGVGVSSQLLNAMLQHDYDLTSGAKLPTISSRPPLDPAIEKALAALRETESKTAALPPIPPSATTPSSRDVPTVPSIESTPQASPLATSVEAGKAEVADPMKLQPAPVAAPIPQAPTSQKPKSLYPVREQFPVELAPPILVVNAASRTPNVIVIDLFPSSR